MVFVYTLGSKIKRSVTNRIQDIYLEIIECSEKRSLKRQVTKYLSAELHLRSSPVGQEAPSDWILCPLGRVLLACTNAEKQRQHGM